MNRRVVSVLSLIAFVAIATIACGGGVKEAPSQEAQTPPAVAQQAAPPAQQPPAAAAPPAAPTQEAPQARAETPAPKAARPKPAITPAEGAASTGAAAPPPATPLPPPAPEPVVKTVPAGTEIEIAFLDGVSSKSSKVGDTFRARVVKDVIGDGIALVPAGSVVVGSVTEVAPLGKIGGQAKLALEFTTLELTSGRSAPISASFAEAGKSETGKDAATIGGAAAGGAILGRLLSKHDKSKGTVLGAIVGGAAGTAVAAKTKGQEVELPSGTVLTLQLKSATQVTVVP
jgi:hypothetical protein